MTPPPITPDLASAATLAALQRFDEAFERHDVDAVTADMTGHCALARTCPAPA